MADTATARYGARQQSQGSNTNTWGDDKLNEALRLLDRGSKGVQSLAMTGDQTLSWTNYVATNAGQCAVLLLTGSLSSAANLVVPSVEWQWDLIKNATGQTVTVKTSAGTGVAVLNGRALPVYCDATDCYNGMGQIMLGPLTFAGVRFWHAMAPCLPQVTGERHARETTAYVTQVHRWHRAMETGGRR